MVLMAVITLNNYKKPNRLTNTDKTLRKKCDIKNNSYK